MHWISRICNRRLTASLATGFVLTESFCADPSPAQCPSPPPADTIYVDKNASCAGANGTCATPYCTIADGLSRIQTLGGAGKVLAVKGNNTVYTEKVTIRGVHQGTDGNPFVFLARGNVILDGAFGTTAWQECWLDNPSTKKAWRIHQASAQGQVIMNNRRYPPRSGLLIDLPVGWSQHVAAQESLYVRFDENYTGQQTYVCTQIPLSIEDASHVRVDGFTVLRSRICGIAFTASASPPSNRQKVTIQNCTVKQSTEQGIDARRGSLYTIQNNSCSENTSHGIYLPGAGGPAPGAYSCTVKNNTCFDNDNQAVQRTSETPAGGGVNGIHIGNGTGTPGNHVIEGNKVYNNEDSGIETNGSNSNVVRYNQSWRNKDHGFDHIDSDSTKNLGNLAYANDRSGISIENNSPHTQIINCVVANNSRDTQRKDWELEILATYGLASDFNLIYRPARSFTCTNGEQVDTVLINYGMTGIAQYGVDYSCVPSPCNEPLKCFGTVARFTAQTTYDSNSLQCNPALRDPDNAVLASADFRPMLHSELVDAANMSSSSWTATDGRGLPRHDFNQWPNIADSGVDARTYDDIGPLELGPPGPPTASVLEWGHDYAIVRWTARGDEWDLGTASTWQIFVNDTERAYGACSAPGVVHNETVVGLSPCAAYTVKVRITALDGQRKSESNVVSGATCCSAQCQGTGPGARAIASLEDFPLSLGSPQPNPSGGSALINWSVPVELSGSSLELALFDIAGRRVRVLHSGTAKAGTFSLPTSLRSGAGEDLRRGMYFLRLQIGEKRLTQTLVVSS